MVVQKDDVASGGVEGVADCLVRQVAVGGEAPHRHLRQTKIISTEAK